MYNAQLTISRIQSLIKERGTTQKEVLSKCEINENTLKRMTDNKGMSSFYLGRIADYLNCSVDYLLGRTNTPNGTYSINNSHTTINGTQANVINSSGETDSLLVEFMKVFNELCFDDKIDVMQYVKNKNTPPKDGGKEK